jgi:Cu2+-exporting ATPase
MSAAGATAAHAFWTGESEDRARAIFAVEGMRCAACASAIERAIARLPGIERASVNGATARVAVDWNPKAMSLAPILAAVTSAGFRPLPLAGEGAARAWKLERRAGLKRIGVAGLGMMQTMMFVAGLYTAARTGVDPHVESYLKLVSLLVATPVLIYAGAPFFRGAWRSLGNRAAGMDVPVALALALAYSASAWNTLRGAGDTYFDSVTMFIFLLLTARYIEMTVRHGNISSSEALARSLPATALRVAADGTAARIPIADIRVGDRISIARGAVIPVDATLLDAQALVDESLVTGEAAPVGRRAGDALRGGSANAGHPVHVSARSTVTGSALASLVGLLERAQAERPRIASAADRVAAWFIAAILAIAALTAVAWYLVDPSRAFPAVLAVLVVTCPCALSLATPAAVAAATTRLARGGVLVTRADAIERLAHIDTVVLDKTGTLTLGSMKIARTSTAAGLSEPAALAIAAALERESNHPVGRAFSEFGDASVTAARVREFPGRGLEGDAGGTTWRIGRRDFVAAIAAQPAAAAGWHDAVTAASVFLGDAAGLQAVFEVTDRVRPDARRALDTLRSLGLRTVIASGDTAGSVGSVARALGVEQACGALQPEHKVAIVRALQSEGRRVLMIGDGINDGPVLAAADVSCAMGEGSAIAQTAADLLLLGESLQCVAEAVSGARRSLRIIRQNLAWALAYNFTAVPLAALGLVPPWAAAIGMSVSSLAVVLNARRLAGAPLGCRAGTASPDAPARAREMLA